MMARIRRGLRRRFDWKDVVVYAGAVVIGLLIVVVLVDQHAGDDRSHHQQSQIDGLSRALDRQRDQVKGLGATPVVPPASKVKADPSAVPTSVPTEGSGPTDEQVRAAVAVYFEQHPVVNNTPPDPGVVQAFVDAYLKAHPAPAGSPGAAGSPGTAGATGAAGADGAKGDPGRGIAATACTDTHLVITYDDPGATTQDLGAGSCGQGNKGDQADPVHTYTYTAPTGPLGQEQSFLCTWDGASKTEPNYSCQRQ